MRVHHLAATLLAGSLLSADARAQLAPVPSAPLQLPALHRTWSRTYGGPSSQHGLFDLRQIPGGRLVVAGYTGSFDGPSLSHWLMRLDLATGDVQFEQASHATTGGIADGAAVAADGGALLLGRTVLDLFIKHDAWLVRTDPAGAVTWSRRFSSAGAGKFFLFDAAELADGSWIAAGSTSLLDQPPQFAWVVRLSSAGVPLWQYKYGGGDVEAARAVIATSDGGFALAGSSSSSGAGSDDAWVLKLGASGAIEWQQTFGGLDADQADDIVELGDGGFAVAGSTNSLTPSGHAPWVLRLDASGALLWHRVVGDGVWGDLGAVARTNDGQVLVVGRVAEVGFPSNDLWCAQLAASDGSVAWQRAYEGETGDYGSAALPLAGSGLVLGGTWGWGFADESIWLQRTDPTGVLAGCDLARTTAFSMVAPLIVVQDGTALRAPGGAQLQAVGVAVTPSDAVVIDVCR